MVGAKEIGNMAERNLRPEQMTPDQARNFVSQIQESRDTRIRGFNMRLQLREIMFWLRRTPRGNE